MACNYFMASLAEESMRIEISVLFKLKTHIIKLTVTIIPNKFDFFFFCIYLIVIKQDQYLLLA